MTKDANRGDDENIVRAGRERTSSSMKGTGVLGWRRGCSGSTKLFLLLIYLVALTVIIWEYQHYIRGWGQEILGLAPSPHDSYSVYHNHCVHYDVIQPPITDFDRIGQILHVSADMLDERIVEQVTNWNGPVSLSIVLFTPEQYACARLTLVRYHREYPIVAANLRAHLVYPREWSKNCSLSVLPLDFCIKREPSMRQKAMYPVNLARNVARLFSATKYILIADFEHLFSEGFETRLREIAEAQNDPKRVLVYRIFEVDESVTEMPRTKKELKALYEKGKAVVFHSKFYNAHNIPQLGQWFLEKSNSTGISQRAIPYSRHDWEPQFVSHRDIPMHDEAFPFLIRDNTVLRWELCRAGYVFDVVSDHFMYHKGIKTTASRKASLSGSIQAVNRKRFSAAMRAFISRMDREYGNSTRSLCPVAKP